MYSSAWYQKWKICFLFTFPKEERRRRKRTYTVFQVEKSQRNESFAWYENGWAIFKIQYASSDGGGVGICDWVTKPNKLHT